MTFTVNGSANKNVQKLTFTVNGSANENVESNLVRTVPYEGNVGNHCRRRRQRYKVLNTYKCSEIQLELDCQSWQFSDENSRDKSRQHIYIAVAIDMNNIKERL